jgi:Carboxypeptidase regulatory-like domain
MMKLFALASISMLVLILPRTEDPEAASLGGRVMDENHVAISAATVSVRHAFSGEVEFAQSDAAGLYRVDGLRQGRYSVFGKAEGHGCTWVFNILLYRGQHTTLDLKLPKSRKEEPANNCNEAARKVR